MIDEAPRGSDQHRGTAAKQTQVAFDRGAAGDRANLGTEWGEEPAQLAGELNRQLPGRSDQQHGWTSGARAGCPSGHRLGHLGGDDEAERHRLPRAGLRGDPQITPGETGGENRPLDVGQSVEAAIGQNRTEAHRDLSEERVEHHRFL